MFVIYRHLYLVVLFGVFALPPYLSFVNFVSVINFGDLAIIILFLLYAARNKLVFSTLLLIPLVLFLNALISILINNEEYVAITDGFFSSLKWLYYYILISVTFSIIKSPNDGISILKGVSLGLLISIIITWVEWYNFPTYNNSFPMLHSINPETRFVINRNYVGYINTIGLSLSFGLFLVTINIERFLWFIAFIIFLISSLLSFSKGTWLSMVLSILFVQFYQPKNKNVLKTFFVTLFCSALLLCFSYSSGYLNLLVDRIRTSESSNVERYIYLIESLEIIYNNLFFGTGPGGYRQASISMGLSNTTDPHNAILWYFSEYGLIGGFLSIFVFIYLLYFSRKKTFYEEINKLQFLSFSMVIPIVVNIPLHGLPVSLKYTWLLLSIVGSSQLLIRKYESIKFEKVLN